MCHNAPYLYDRNPRGTICTSVPLLRILRVTCPPRPPVIYGHEQYSRLWRDIWSRLSCRTLRLQTDTASFSLSSALEYDSRVDSGPWWRQVRSLARCVTVVSGQWLTAWSSLHALMAELNARLSLVLMGWRGVSLYRHVMHCRLQSTVDGQSPLAGCPPAHRGQLDTPCKQSPTCPPSRGQNITRSSTNDYSNNSSCTIRGVYEAKLTEWLDCCCCCCQRDVITCWHRHTTTDVSLLTLTSLLCWHWRHEALITGERIIIVFCVSVYQNSLLSVTQQTVIVGQGRSVRRAVTLNVILQTVTWGECAGSMHVIIVCCTTDYHGLQVICFVTCLGNK